MNIALRNGVAAIVLGLTVFSTGAAAGERGGVKVTGNVTTTTIVGSSTTVAKGIGAKAITSVGSIHRGTRQQGDVNITTIVKSVANVADGFGSKSCIAVGAIGKNPCK